MSVDPDIMVVAPSPMSRDPAPVSAAGPVARAIRVVRPVTDVDADANRIGGCGKAAYAKQSSKK